MGKTDKSPVSEMEQLAATITEGTKNTLRDILSEAVSSYLREEVLAEDDDEMDDEETPETETSDVPEFDEPSDDAKDAEEDSMEADEADAESDKDEWSDFDDYKIGDDEGSEEYDFTKETNPETLVRVFKLMKNDDQVSVVKDGDKVCIKDNEADTEYVIELDADSSDDNDDFNTELTMESNLGYTTKYQKESPIEGLTMGDAPANTNDWDEGTPKGTERPYGKPGKSDPFGTKTEKVYEITLNDEVVDDETETEEVLDENQTTTASQRRRMTKTLAPANSNELEGEHVVSREGKLNKSLQEKINAAIQENKQLKETVSKVTKIMKEAVQVNVNLGHIVRLMVENSTTKAEKEDIVKRFANVKTNESAKTLYESISSELKKAHSTVMTEQTTTVENTKKINESKIYDEPNGVIDMMRRMHML